MGNKKVLDSIVRMNSIRVINKNRNRIDFEVYDNSDDLVIRVMHDDGSTVFVVDGETAQEIIDFVADGYDGKKQEGNEDENNDNQNEV